MYCVLKKFGISKPDEMHMDSLYDILIESVVKEHTLDDGITVCKDCHSKIDIYYKG